MKLPSDEAVAAAGPLLDTFYPTLCVPKMLAAAYAIDEKKIREDQTHNIVSRLKGKARGMDDVGVDPLNSRLLIRVAEIIEMEFA